jgi:hypothetical protein
MGAAGGKRILNTRMEEGGWRMEDGGEGLRVAC